MTKDTRHDPRKTCGPAAAMTLTRFESLIDAHGGAAERWPAGERDAALALLARSPAARVMRETAARLDALLDRAPAEPPSAALVERILAAAPVAGPVAGPAPALEAQHGHGIGGRLAGLAGRLWPDMPVWQPAAALATALLLGLSVGYTVQPFDGDAGPAISGEGTELLAFGVLSDGEASP